MALLYIFHDALEKLDNKKRVCAHTLIFVKKKSKKNLEGMKKCLTFAALSWKQSFYLKKTNTYWRYRATACEGHRFIFFPLPKLYCVISVIIGGTGASLVFYS